ncbi:MAG: hypothetical protein RLZZ543_345 [Bacteroidota bacterium]|jgi:hypothetical protein
MSAISKIDNLLNQFQPASLADMERLKLLNRVDQKYIFRLNELASILEEVSPFYTILSVNDKRHFQYNTLYFDTKGFTSYIDHHNGKPNRFKLRYRRYLDSGDVFFEIKKKIKGLRTDKHRITLDEIPDLVGENEMKLMEQCGLPNMQLQPSMWVNYRRITLMSKDSPERVTIDLNLEFSNEIGNASLDGLVIVEVKQAKASRNSRFMERLRNRKIREIRISKYSIAVALLNHHLKNNAFGTKIRRIKHLIDEQWNQAS